MLRLLSLLEHACTWTEIETRLRIINHVDLVHFLLKGRRFQIAMRRDRLVSVRALERSGSGAEIGAERSKIGGAGAEW